MKDLDLTNEDKQILDDLMDYISEWIYESTGDWSHSDWDYWGENWSNSGYGELINVIISAAKAGELHSNHAALRELAQRIVFETAREAVEILGNSATGESQAQHR